MSHQRASARVRAVPSGSEDIYDAQRAAVQRRRAQAARVRRRRLLVADVGLGLLLALIGLILAPGLAIVALGAAVVLAGCGASVLYERRLSRRPVSRRAPGGRAAPRRPSQRSGR